MPKLILHHFDYLPFAEQARLVLGQAPVVVIGADPDGHALAARATGPFLLTCHGNAMRHVALRGLQCTSQDSQQFGRQDRRIAKTQPFGYHILPTVLRFRGLLVVIYPNDHWPPHVHVIGAGREAKVALGLGGQRPSILTNEGLSRRELAAALVEIDRNRDLLVERWREIHGDA